MRLTAVWSWLTKFATQMPGGGGTSIVSCLRLDWPLLLLWCVLLLNSDPMGTDVQYLGKLTLFGATGNNGCSLLVKNGSDS